MSREGIVLVALLTLFACRAMIASALVPPWQGPDEPTHFSLTYGLTLPPEARGQPVQAAVLRSMARHGWWAAYEDVPPTPFPTSFGSVDGLGPGSLEQPLYYRLGALALTISRPPGIETAYYDLRFLSVVLSVLTLTFGWLGTRLLFGPEIGTGAAVITTLHPQFLLAAITVNADALLYVWGAFAWWQAGRALTGHHRALSIALMLGGAVAALLTKRIGMILVASTVIVALVSLSARTPWRTAARRSVLLLAIMAAAGVLALWAASVFLEDYLRAWLYIWADAFTVRRTQEDATFAEALKFVGMTIDYSWLIGGWLRFPPPDVWLWASRILIVAGMGGALLALAESSSLRPRLLIAWLFVIVQSAAMLGVVFFTVQTAPQARYLFPVFAPIAVLLYVGLRHLWPGARRRHWLPMLAMTLAILDLTGFAYVHIPAYVK